MYPSIELLKEKLKLVSSSNERLEHLHELVWEHIRRDLPEAHDYLQEAQKLLKPETINPNNAIHHDLLQGFLHAVDNDYVKALPHVNRVMGNLYDVSSGIWQARAHCLMGYIHLRSGDYVTTMSEFQQQYDIACEVEDAIGQAIALNGIGLTCERTQDYSTALDYYEQCIEIALTEDDLYIQFEMWHGRARVYLLTNKIDKAIAAGQMCLKLANQRSSKSVTSNAYLILGEIYVFTTAYSRAQQAFAVALKLSGNEKRLQLRSITASIGLANVYTLSGEPDKALEILNSTLSQANVTQHKRFIYLCHETLSNAYEKQGDYKQALYHHKEYLSVYKQASNESKLEKVQILEVIHRTKEAQIEADLHRQRAEDVKRRASEDRQYFEELTKIKNEFLHSATHDLKNPLAVIVLNAQILRRKTDLNLHRHIEQVEYSARRMNRLITDMLELAKLETGKAIQVMFGSLTELVNNLHTEYREVADIKSINIQVIYTPASNNLQFYFDPDYMYRVLSNLLSNAIKYSPENTEVSIHIEVSASKVMIEITDNGFGIPEDDLTHIFERFYRVHTEDTENIEGTGLGLSIVKTIIEQHGGSITVDSQVHEGTTFRISLPYLTYPDEISQVG